LVEIERLVHVHRQRAPWVIILYLDVGYSFAVDKMGVGELRRTFVKNIDGVPLSADKIFRLVSLLQHFPSLNR